MCSMRLVLSNCCVWIAIMPTTAVVRPCLRYSRFRRVFLNRVGDLKNGICILGRAKFLIRTHWIGSVWTHELISYSTSRIDYKWGRGRDGMQRSCWVCCVADRTITSNRFTHSQSQTEQRSRSDRAHICISFDNSKKRPPSDNDINQAKLMTVALIVLKLRSLLINIYTGCTSNARVDSLVRQESGSFIIF